MPISRRTLLASALAALPAARLAAQSQPAQVERWDLFELGISGPSTGNPFLEIQFSATFRHQHRSVEVDGFYDGAGVFKLRFSPDAEGEWTWTTHRSEERRVGKECRSRWSPYH